MSGLDAAVAAASRGWAVFPCRPGDKRPAVDRWEERACSDPERVARYWPSGRYNVGVACGPSGLVVIDLDVSPDDAAGRTEMLAPFGAQQLGKIVKEAARAWPDTLTVQTPSGGWHLYYAAIVDRVIRNSAGKIGPKIDVRGAGGYVVGVGSVVGGRAYEVTDDRPATVLPGWLADLADPPQSSVRPAAQVSGQGSVPGRLRGMVAAVLDARVGTRNDVLFWAACRAAEMVSSGDLGQADAAEVLTRAGEAAGLAPAEVAATVASGLREVRA